MLAKPKYRVIYATVSPFKQQELKAFLQAATLEDGTRVIEVFEFEFRDVPVKETLVVDIVEYGADGGS